MAASFTDSLEAGFASLRQQFGDRVDDVLALLAVQLDAPQVVATFAKRRGIASEGDASQALLSYLAQNPLPLGLVQSAIAGLQSWAASTGTMSTSDGMRRLLAQTGTTMPVQGSVRDASSLFALRLARSP